MMMPSRYTTTHTPTKWAKALFINIAKVEGALVIPKFIYSSCSDPQNVTGTASHMGLGMIKKGERRRRGREMGEVI